MTFNKLRETISQDVWKIECYDMLKEDALARWERLPKTHGPKIVIERYVGSALIALEKRGFINFDD